jgi:hypothetical protein
LDKVIPRQVLERAKVSGELGWVTVVDWWVCQVSWREEWVEHVALQDWRVPEKRLLDSP